LTFYGIFTRNFGLVAWLLIFLIAVCSCGTQQTGSESEIVPLGVVPPVPPEPVEPIIEMVSVPGGSFSMGDPGEADNRPVHTVTVNDFLMGKYEVTQGQYFQVTGKRPGNFYTNPDDESEDGWMKLPVEKVSWYDALVFCNKLSIREGLNPVYRIKGRTNPNDWGNIPTANNKEWNEVVMVGGADGYRLPTEAEWEYAARGGGLSKSFRYAGSNTPDSVAWYYDNSDSRVREAGKKPPNELDLYDMSGNVMEWCWDWFNRYSSGSKNNPTGPHTAHDSVQTQKKVIRGGGWSGAVQFCRVTYRRFNDPSYDGVDLGFRVVRSQ